MVNLPEKGDFYSKFTKVSMLLLLCAVARSIYFKEKEKNALNNQFTCKMQRNVAK